MVEVKQILEQQLEKLGLSRTMIRSVLKSMAHFLCDEPDMDLREINERLQYIGWDGIEIDYHTLQLVKTWYETRSPEAMTPAGASKWHESPL